MRYDNDGLLLSMAYGEALIEGGERGVLCPHSGVGELGQERPEGAIALPRFARALLARTFILPWCHTGPCGQARGGLKARHIDPDLRHDHFRATLIAPRNGVQSSTARVKVRGGETAPDGALFTASSGGGASREGSAVLRACKDVSMAALSASICSSRKSMWASCIASNCRWWSWTMPVKACSSKGIFDRMRRFARAAIVAGSARPAMSASSMARPETPIISAITEASLILARSSTP